MALQLQPIRFSLPRSTSTRIYAATHSSPPPIRRRALSLLTITIISSNFGGSNYAWPRPEISDFVELQDSGGVKALDLRIGDVDAQTPSIGDKVVIHYYGRLAAKQGWRFDSTYDHKDENGEPIPFEFVLGSGEVISGIESAVRSMRVGGIRSHYSSIPRISKYISATHPTQFFRQTEVVHHYFQPNSSSKW